MTKIDEKILNFSISVESHIGRKLADCIDETLVITFTSSVVDDQVYTLGASKGTEVFSRPSMDSSFCGNNDFVYTYTVNDDSTFITVEDGKLKVDWQTDDPSKVTLDGADGDEICLTSTVTTGIGE